MRLRIKVNTEDFDHKLIHFLSTETTGLEENISPYSIKSLPGELRLNLKYRGKLTHNSGAIIGFMGSEEEVVKISPSKEQNTNNSPKQKKNKKPTLQNMPIVPVPQKKDSVKVVGTKKNNSHESIASKEELQEKPHIEKECIRSTTQNGKPKFVFKNKK